jgi:uncharacterized protein DUF6152
LVSAPFNTKPVGSILEHAIARLGAHARTVLVTAALLMMSLDAVAHHSYTDFDRSRTLTIAGTVLKMDWTNPHVHLWIQAPDAAAAGGSALYGLEAGSVGMLSRFGWNRSTFQVGEKISVDFYPLLDGQHAGAFIRARHADQSVTSGDLAGVNYFSR